MRGLWILCYGIDLSYTSDVLNAFKGIESVLGRAMKTRFWYGIPEIYIDYGLLWTAKHARSKAPERLVRLQAFPSWCWAGWNWWVELGDYFQPEGLKREVSWFLINHDGEAIQMESKDIPGRTPFPQKCNTDAASRLKYRNHDIPVKVRRRSNVDIESPKWRSPDFLAAWTTVAHFWLTGKTVKPSIRDSSWRDSYNLAILNDQGDWAGSIVMDKLWAEENVSKDNSVEFMLMSRSENNRSGWNEAVLCDEDIFVRRSWCMLNVMLIQWSGETAERLGVGVIHEDAWVHANPMPSFVRIR